MTYPDDFDSYDTRPAVFPFDEMPSPKIQAGERCAVCAMREPRHWAGCPAKARQDEAEAAS